MKKTKIIVPALGMLLLSTAASVTGTVAWFAVNTSVTVTGLEVKAKAEGGIVIAPYTLRQTSVEASSGTTPNRTNSLVSYQETAPLASSFKNTATNNIDEAELYPTSTPDASSWYHATSNDVNVHTAASSYTEMSGSLTGDGKIVTGNGQEAGEGLYAISGQYFLYNKYVVKSTNESEFSLYVSAVTVTGEANNSQSKALNDSLRVAVVLGTIGTDSPAFFAPMYATDEGGTLVCYNGSETAAYNPTITKGSGNLASNVQVGASNAIDDQGIDLHIFVYYEGEDPNCKTINTDGITIDSLSIDLTFTTIA